ncbi:hypothetical protein BH23CHL5_BH23CHL5_09050 [soil metagenome]
MDQQEFLAAVTTSWDRLISSLEQVPPVIRATPPDPSETWSVKDVVAHISFWEVVALHKMRGTATLHAGLDVDEANDIEFGRSKDRSWDDVWAEFHSTHEELVEQLKAPASVVLDDISEDTWEHYDEHRQWLEAWLDPMIQ